MNFVYNYRNVIQVLKAYIFPYVKKKEWQLKYKSDY